MLGTKRKRSMEDDGQRIGNKGKASPQTQTQGRMAEVIDGPEGFEEEDDTDLEENQTNGDGIDDENKWEDEDEEDEDEDAEANDFDDEFTSAPPPTGPELSEPPGSHPSKRGPTAQELRQLREASDLFKSSAFKLKVDAFLPTLRPPESKTPALHSFLHTLRTHLLSLPSISPTHPLQAQALPGLQGVRIPYPLPRPAQEVNWKVSFSPPSEIHVIGSWPTGTALSIPGRKGGGKREWDIDLGVVMPTEIFEKKDYLNGRVWHKHAFYLAALAAGVMGSDMGVQTRFECPSGDERVTRLVLRPGNGLNAPFSSSFAIHIHLLLPRGDSFPFPHSHLSPSRASFHTTDKAPPTPLYNNLVLSLSLPITLLVTIHQFTKDIPGYRDALALLRAWASRRGFERSSRPSEFSVLGFEGRGVWWALLLGGCVQGWEESSVRPHSGTAKSRLARGMSSYQLFRGALDFLQSWDWSKPLRMKTRSIEVKTRETEQEWTLHHECIFLETSGSVNVLSGVPRSSLELLKHEASLAMRVLDDDSGDAFDLLFLRDLGMPLARFDAVLRVDVAGALPIMDLRAQQLDRASSQNALLHSVQDVLTKALSTRVKCVNMFQRPVPDWEVMTDRSSAPTEVIIGLIFEPSRFSRIVDHGPPADDIEACEAFRAFWGDKAELRRFKDGSITECVVWDARSQEDRANIPSRVVAYALGRHFRIPEAAITAYQPMLDRFIQLPPSAVRDITGHEQEIEYKNAVQAYDRLVKELKAIEDFPLSLLNVSAAAEGLRYTSVFPPLSSDPGRASSLPDCLRHIPAHGVILEFEASTKWPDDLIADQKIKLAFFEDIASKLKVRLPDAHVAVVLDAPPALPIEDNCLMELIMPGGIAFHARIYHNRERTLLERIIMDPSTSDAERKQATAVLERFEQRFVECPRHHAAIATLHHKFPAFSPAVRLVKRWLAGHLLLPHVPEELVELLCAYMFLSPAPFAPPTGLCDAFVRMLHLLSTWRWASEPLLVPLYSSKDAEPSQKVTFPSEKRAVAQDTFSSVRSADPGISGKAWFIATEQDLHGVAWAKNAPSALIARRITQLAKTSYRYVDSAFEQESLQALALFNPPYDDYDFVLQLETSMLPRYYQSLSADERLWQRGIKFRNLPSQQSSIYGPGAKVGFDPAYLYFRDLQRVYGDVCMFFFDPLGGDKIAGIWNPAVLRSAPFKVLLGFNSKPHPSPKAEGANPTGQEAAKGKPLVELNTEAVLSEIAALGAGIVKTVTVKR